MTVLSLRRVRAVRRAFSWIVAGHCLAALTVAALPTQASAQRVRASNFSDVDFGMLGNLQGESRRSQNLCIYSNGQNRSYSVSASGSGPGSTFALSDGSFSLPFDVEWSDSANQSAGTPLVPNVTLAGQLSSANNQFCSTGPAASASLAIVLRGADLSTARAGSYSGSLTILIVAE
jgi:hypothetical protein